MILTLLSSKYAIVIVRRVVEKDLIHHPLNLNKVIENRVSYKPEAGETPALFIERIKSYLEKWIETAGLEKEYEAHRDLFIKEQTLNVCPRELAAHLKEQKDQSLQALADAAKQYLEAHNTKFAHYLHYLPVPV